MSKQSVQVHARVSPLTKRRIEVAAALKGITVDRFIANAVTTALAGISFADELRAVEGKPREETTQEEDPGAAVIRKLGYEVDGPPLKGSV